MQAVISLGSNMGDRQSNLKSAVRKISEIANIITEGKVIETLPWGETEQENFLNQIIIIETRFKPKELLGNLLKIEQTLGRVRLKKWGPRIIDLDILFLEERVIKNHELIVPHPYLHEREFILKPLMELIPDFIHPLENKTIKELYHRLIDSKER